MPLFLFAPQASKMAVRYAATQTQKMPGVKGITYAAGVALAFCVALSSYTAYHENKRTRELDDAVGKNQ